MSEANNIKDVVVEALKRKRPRSGRAKGNSSKDAPPVKNPDTIEKVSPLKTIPPHLPKVSETSGVASDKGPATSSPPIAQKSQLLHK